MIGFVCLSVCLSVSVCLDRLSVCQSFWSPMNSPKPLNQILTNFTSRRHIPSPCGIVNLNVICSGMAVFFWKQIKLGGNVPGHLVLCAQRLPNGVTCLVPHEEQLFSMKIESDQPNVAPERNMYNVYICMWTRLPKKLYWRGNTMQCNANYLAACPPLHVWGYMAAPAYIYHSVLNSAALK